MCSLLLISQSAMCLNVNSFYLNKNICFFFFVFFFKVETLLKVLIVTSFFKKIVKYPNETKKRLLKLLKTQVDGQKIIKKLQKGIKRFFFSIHNTDKVVRQTF